VAAAIALAIGAYRLFRSTRRPVDRRQRLGVPAQGRLAARAELRPLVVRRPTPGRPLIGPQRRALLATENNPYGSRKGGYFGDIGAVIAIGPSRSGKTRSLLAGIGAWDGPAILSSVKTDLLAATYPSRSARGDIKVFDPSGVAGHRSAQWTPLDQARSLVGAHSIAKGLVDATPSTGQDDDGWLA